MQTSDFTPLSEFAFEAVLWDMDGSLVDSEPLWIEQETLLMRDYGVTWSEADAIACVGGPMTRVEGLMREKLRHDQVANLSPMQLTMELLERMESRFAQGVEFAPGAGDLLREMLSLNLPLGLVSASSRALVDSVLEGIGGEVFQITISNDDVELSKPHPEGYLKAAKHLQVDIERCLIIEDSITGMNAAIASQAHVLGVPHVTQLPLADKVIHLPTLHGVNYSTITKLFATASN